MELSFEDSAVHVIEDLAAQRAAAPRRFVPPLPAARSDATAPKSAHTPRADSSGSRYAVSDSGGSHRVAFQRPNVRVRTD